MNARSRATRTFVSMLVLFFLRRPGSPSKPMEGEDSELGLGRVLSMDMVSEEEEYQHIIRHRVPQVNDLCWAAGWINTNLRH